MINLYIQKGWSHIHLFIFSLLRSKLIGMWYKMQLLYIHNKINLVCHSNNIMTLWKYEDIHTSSNKTMIMTMLCSKLWYINVNEFNYPCMFLLSMNITNNPINDTRKKIFIDQITSVLLVEYNILLQQQNSRFFHKATMKFGIKVIDKELPDFLSQFKDLGAVSI